MPNRTGVASQASKTETVTIGTRTRWVLEITSDCSQVSAGVDGRNLHVSGLLLP